MQNFRKHLASGVLALALSAGAASAATLSIGGSSLAGSIPGGAANSNDSLIPLGLGALGSLTGYYGSQINLIGNANVTFELLGAEAGNTNSFTYNPTSQTLTDAGGGSFFNPLGISSFSVANVLAGLLDFSFFTSGGSLTVTNGFNPNNTGSGINFFASFGDNSALAATSGSVLYLFFDDDGANDDDNHDDLVMRVTVAAVPLPAAGFLLFGALGGLALLRRRKTA